MKGTSMRIGYACLTNEVPATNIKRCIQRNASKERLSDLISWNLSSFEHILKYNLENNIKLFRISSDIIPFGSSPVNTLSWWDMYSKQLCRLGEFIRDNGMRVSMHPGQYTVLNSSKEEIVEKAILDLEYHTRVLDSMELGKEHKIILHIGGVYNDKVNSIGRFISHFSALDDSVKKRLVIENDDKSYTIEDVLYIATKIGIPVVFDNLHHKINPSCLQKDQFCLIEECKKTWKPDDGFQKIHYSQQHPFKNPGAHSDTIETDEFMLFYRKLNRKDIDIMLEVKDKNKSAVKCIKCISLEN